MKPRALVTGGARRVGLAIAEEFARAGLDVEITWHSTRPDAAVERLRSLGADARSHRADLSDPEQVEELARRVLADGRGLDVLVHNASEYAPGDLSAVTAESADRFMRVNAVAPLVLSARCAAALAGSSLEGGGAIVAMCDVHACGLPRKGYSAYSMSKAALAEMVRSLAVELAPRVRAVGVAPGVVAWPEQGEEARPEAQRAYLQRVPLGRAGTPEEAARVVRWLALDASYLTGVIIPLDGGRSLR